MNASPFNSALSNLTARFNLVGELLLENGEGGALDLTDTLKLLKEQGTLNSVIATVWVPTQLVLLTEVFVPGSRKSDWMSALPYSLEESLSEPVELFHFVTLNRSSKGDTAVAIVEHQWMTTWLQTLKDHGLSHAQLIPDCFRLPLKQTATDSAGEVNEGAISFETDDTLLIRTSQFSGLATNSDWLAQIQTIQNLEPQEIPSSQLLNSQNATDSLKGLSLRTDEYRKQSKGLYYWRQWRWSLLLLVLILITTLTTTWLETQKIETQIAETKAQTKKLFKQMFPDVKRIVDIRTQTLTRINQNDSAQANGLSAMEMMGVIEPLFAKVPEITIKKVSWRTATKGGQLVLTVEAEQTDQLQKVTQLAQQSNLAVTIKLELKNVSPELAEGVFNVTTK